MDEREPNFEEDSVASASRSAAGEDVAITSDPLTPADLAGIDVPCPGCAYNLRDGVGGGCPECGRTLVRDDVLPPINDLSLLPDFDTKRSSVPRRDTPEWLVTGVLMLGLAFGAGVLLFVAAGVAVSRSVFGWLLVLAAGALLLGTACRLLTRVRRSGRWILLVGVAAAAAAILLLILDP